MSTDAKNRFDDSLLYTVVLKGSAEDALEFLGEGGFDKVDRDGRTLLSTAVIEGRFDIAKALIERGANVGAKDGRGLMALHFAAIRGRDQAAALLIASGADIDPQDGVGNTPLWRAVMNDSETVAEQLLKAGADETRKNMHGVSARDLRTDGDGA